MCKRVFCVRIVNKRIMWYLTDCTGKNGDSQFEGISFQRLSGCYRQYWMRFLHRLLRSFQTGLLITVSTAIHYWILYRYEWRQSLFSLDISVTYILILFSELNFGLPRDLVPSRFPCQYYCAFLVSLKNLT